MIKTGKHFKLVSNIGKVLGAAAFVAGTITIISFPNALVGGMENNKILDAMEYDNYVSEQTEIYDTQLENNEISQEEHDDLCKDLDDKDAFIKKEGTPLQIEYYNLTKNQQDIFLTSMCASFGCAFVLTLASGFLSEIATAMEKKYKKDLEKYSNIDNCEI